MTEPWYSKIKSTFWRSLISPFCICWKYKVESFIWVMFVIVAGQLGTIINLIRRWVFGDWDFFPALGPDAVSGSFYTFALVLIASLVAPIFIRFIKKEKPEYRSISAVYLTVLIFSLVLCAIFYSFATNDINSVDFSKLSNDDMKADWKQLTFFFLSLIFAWYSFGLSHLSPHENQLCLDDYQELDDNARNELSEKLNPLGGTIGKKSDSNEKNKTGIQGSLVEPSSNTKYGELNV